MTRKLAIDLLGMASAFVLAGCGTIAGVGQDISATGQAVENVATDNAPRVYTYDSPRVYYCDRYYYDQWGNRHCY